jgi:hypothetical protein
MWVMLEVEERNDKRKNHRSVVPIILKIKDNPKKNKITCHVHPECPNKKIVKQIVHHQAEQSNISQS